LKNARLCYCGTAVVMGLVWYAALLVAPATRGFLLKSWSNWSHSLIVWRVESVPLLCLASFGVATTWRRWIVQARGWQHLFLGVVLPFYGCVLFLCGVIVVSHVEFAQPFGIVHPENLGTLFWGLVTAMTSAHVVIPMGLLSQLVMHRVGHFMCRETNGPEASHV